MKKLISLLLVVAAFVTMLPLGSINAEVTFSDVKEEQWFYYAVEYCYNKGLMNGLSATTFDPDGTTSREMFVKTLANMEGINEADYKEAAEKTPFKDVETGAWYSPAVEWARQTGIVDGVAADAFGVAQPVTREQIAKMLKDYAEYKGKDVSVSADLSEFSDAEKISPWAVNGFKYAVAARIFKGNTNKELNPNGNATRAELATILKSIRVQENNRLVCWGDSLTEGVLYGGILVDETYPERVAATLNVPYLNFGIGGEKAETIAMRQGGIPIYIDDVTIPADTTPVVIQITAEGGYDTSGLDNAGDVGLNIVTIDGIEGRITWDSEYQRHSFTRLTAGDEIVITEPTQIITSGMGVLSENDILVICSGTNNTEWRETPEEGMYELIKIQQTMIDYAGTDKFIIVGIPAVSYVQTVHEYNYILEEYWGEHFVDMNPYMMSEECFEKYGLTLKGGDRKDLYEGRIPRCLLDDKWQLHPNQTGYNVIADLVSERINELGYLN